MGETGSQLDQVASKSRRRFLNLILRSGAVISAPGLLLFKPTQVWASWPKNAFEATTVQSALFALHGRGDTTTVKYAAEVKARPHLDAGGTHVTVEVKTNLPDIDSITVLANSNRTPLVACFKFHEQEVKSLITRIKMNGKGEVVAILKSRERLISEAATVDFSGCGCG